MILGLFDKRAGRIDNIEVFLLSLGDRIQFHTVRADNYGPVVHSIKGVKGTDPQIFEFADNLRRMNNRPECVGILILAGRLKSQLGCTLYPETKTGLFCKNNFHRQDSMDSILLRQITTIRVSTSSTESRDESIEIASSACLSGAISLSESCRSRLATSAIVSSRVTVSPLAVNSS